MVTAPHLLADALDIWWLQGSWQAFAGWVNKSIHEDYIVGGAIHPSGLTGAH